MAELDTKKKAVDYAVKINSAWRSAFNNILETGKLLAKAKDELGKTEWGKMVDEELTINRRTANKLIEIVNDERLIAPENAVLLPPHWSTLHSLKYLTDDQFDGALEKGLIHPDMMRKDVERLRKKPKQKSKRKVLGPKPKPVSDDSSTDLSFKTSGDDEFDLPLPEQALAILSHPQGLTDDDAGEIERELDKLRDKFGVKFQFNGYSSEKEAKLMRRQNLASKMLEWHQEKRKIYNRNQAMTAQELRLYGDILWQLNTRSKFAINTDGTYHPNDLRHPDNPYHHAIEVQNDPDEFYHVLEEIYSECDYHHILTQYTPIEYFDYFAYLNILIYEHCVGDDKRRKEIEGELSSLNKKEHDIHDGEIAAEKARQEGKSFDEYQHLIPAAQTDFRDMDLDTCSDITPGYARAAFGMLIK